MSEEPLRYMTKKRLVEKITQLQAEIDRLNTHIEVQARVNNDAELSRLRKIEEAAKAWMNKGFGYAPTASVVFEIVNGRGPDGEVG